MVVMSVAIAESAAMGRVMETVCRAIVVEDNGKNVAERSGEKAADRARVLVWTEYGRRERFDTESSILSFVST